MKDVMNIPELAEYLKISKSKIYKMIKNKRIPASKIERQYRFLKVVVDEWIKSKADNFIQKGGEK